MTITFNTTNAIQILIETLTDQPNDDDALQELHNRLLQLFEQQHQLKKNESCEYTSNEDMMGNCKLHVHHCEEFLCKVATTYHGLNDELVCGIISRLLLLLHHNNMSTCNIPSSNNSSGSSLSSSVGEAVLRRYYIHVNVQESLLTYFLNPRHIRPRAQSTFLNLFQEYCLNPLIVRHRNAVRSTQLLHRILYLNSDFNFSGDGNSAVKEEDVREARVLSIFQQLRNVAQKLLLEMLEANVSHEADNDNIEQHQQKQEQKCMIDEWKRMYSIAPDAIHMMLELLDKREELENLIVGDNDTVGATPSSTKLTNSPASIGVQNPFEHITSRSTSTVSSLSSPSHEKKIQHDQNNIKGTPSTSHQQQPSSSSSSPSVQQLIKINGRAVSQDLEPLGLSTDNDLYNICQDVQAKLSNIGADFWHVRRDALVTLRRLVAGGILFHDNDRKDKFVQFIKHMPICEQIEDLRSQITREACELASDVIFALHRKHTVNTKTNAKGANNRATELVELWIPSLLKLSISGIRIMSQQGERCLLELMTYGAFPRLLPIFIDGITVKGKRQHHKLHRKCCIRCVAAALRVWPISFNSMYSSLITAIESAMTDKDPDVRLYGRHAYWALFFSNESAAQKLFSKLDSTNRNRLTKRRTDADELWKEDNELQQYGTMTRLMRGEDVNVVGGNDPRCGRGSSSRSNSRIHARITSSGSHENGVHTKNSNVSISNCGGNNRRENLNGTTAAPGNNDKPWRRNTNKTNGSRIPRPTATTPPSRLKKSAVSTTNVDNETDTVAPSRPMSTRPSSSSTSNTTVRSVYGIRGPPLRRTLRKPVLTPSAPSSGTSNNMNKSSNTSVMNINTFLQMTKDPLWSTRERAYLQVKQLNMQKNFTNGNHHSSSNSSTTTKFLHALETAMHDHHHRVSMAAIDALTYSLQERHDKSKTITLVLTKQNHLHAILPVLLAQWCGNNTQTKRAEAAERCLYEIKREVEAHVMIPLLQQLLINEPMDRVKCNILDLLLIPLAKSHQGKEYFITSKDRNHCYLAFRCMASVLSGRPSIHLRRSIDSWMLVLFEISEANFIGELLDLPRDSYLVLENAISGSSMCRIIYESIGVPLDNCEIVDGPLDIHIDDNNTILHDEVNRGDGDSLLMNGESTMIRTSSTTDKSYSNDNIDDYCQKSKSKAPFQDRTSDLINVERNHESSSSQSSSSDKGEYSNTKYLSLVNTSPPPSKLSPSAAFSDDVCVSTCPHSSNPSSTPKALTHTQFDSTPVSAINKKCDEVTKTPMTDPVIRYMIKPPISEELHRYDESISSLISSLSSDQIEDNFLGMQTLSRLAKEMDDGFWTKHIDRVVPCLIDGAMAQRSSKGNDDDAVISQLYLQGLRALIKYQPNRIPSLMNMIVNGVMMTIQQKNDNLNVLHVAEKVLENLIHALPALDYFKCLISFLMMDDVSFHHSQSSNKRILSTARNDSAILLAVLRCYGKLIPHIASEDLRAEMTALMPHLTSSVCHPKLELRKCAVFVIVEMYWVIGDDVLEHLDELNDCQRKLVVVYIERHEKWKGSDTVINYDTAGKLAQQEAVNQFS